MEHSNNTGAGMNSVLDKLVETVLLDIEQHLGQVIYDISGAGHISRYDLEQFDRALTRRAQKNGYSVTVFYPKRANRLKATSDEKIVCRMVQMPDNYHVAIAMAKRD